MINIQLARKYARAIFELAQEGGKLESYGKDLASIRTAIFGQEDFKGFALNPQIPVKAKKEVIGKVFAKGTLEEEVYSFLLLLADKRRLALIEEIVTEYKALSNGALGVVIADVTTAIPMETSQEQTLKEKLETVSGKRVELRTHVDKSIVGGVIVQIGDKRIDGSVTGRLETLKSEILANQ